MGSILNPGRRPFRIRIVIRDWLRHVDVNTGRKRLVPDAVGSFVSLKVEVWSDVVCPWCYIGKRRFEAALARFDHRDEVELVWRSFELDVSAPPSSADQGTYVERLAGKYGCSVIEAQAMIDNMTITAAQEGLDFRFDLARPGNTFDAHRLLHLASEHGMQDELKERLDHATFTEGSPVSDHAALRALATQVGLPEIEVDAVLTSGRYSDAVRADEAQARAYGISGVPFFVIDGRYGISGAQPADAVLQTLDKAWSEYSPLTLVTLEGSAPSCEGDSCSV
jgi:predicted DsbA family dithiol-disulfide isomerase